MTIKKIRGIIIALLVIVIAAGCSVSYKEYEKFDTKSEIDKSYYLLKNYKYKDVCDKDYQSLDLIDDGVYRCTYNDIKTKFNLLEDNIGMKYIELTYSGPSNNQKVLAEINKIYQSNNLKPMKEAQFKQLLNRGYKRVFNDMMINYWYDKEHDENVISTTGYKITSEYPKENYLD